MQFKREIVCLLLLLLAACSGKPEKPPYAGIKIGKPYEVYGRWYEPHYSAHYDETGMASWYGPGFHGGHTASGERFDENEMTAAHKTLPLPSIVRVTNLENGMSALIKVNDRGPFAHDRIIDLSRAAALRLGVWRTGTARVRVQFLERETKEYVQNSQNSIQYAMSELKTVNPEEAAAFEERGAQPTLRVEAKIFPDDGVKPATPTSADAPMPPIEAAVMPATAVEAPQTVPVPGGDADEFSVVDNHAPAAPPSAYYAPVKYKSPPPIAAPAGARYFIQAGTFSQQANALSLSDRLAGAGTPQVMEIMMNGKKLYRVMTGPFESRMDAKNMLSQLASIGISDAKIIHN